MTPSYSLSVLAQVDLEEIWRYTFEEWDVDQADKYLNLLFFKIYMLS